MTLAARCDSQPFLTTRSGISVYNIGSSEQITEYDLADMDGERRQLSPRIVRVEDTVYISAEKDGLLRLGSSGEIEWYSEVGGEVLLDEDNQSSAIYVGTGEYLYKLNGVTE
jgi:hypothetical protein